MLKRLIPKARKSIIIFLIGSLLLPARWLAAQEYLDLWHNSKTDNFYLIQKKFNEYFAGRDQGRGTGYKQFKRWENFIEPRVYPSGKLINPSKLALDEELRYQGDNAASLLTTAHNGNWQSLGIKNYKGKTGSTGGMGRVNCIAPHPTDPKTLFAGTPAGGLWKTTDGGSNWLPLSDGIPVLGVSSIAINPHNPDSIYILTGDGDGESTNCTGVLLSTNGGDTWQSTGLQFGVFPRVKAKKLLMHPTNSNTLFALINGAIHETTNGGITWTVKIDDYIGDMVFKPGSASVIYAVSGPTFYTSFDSGETWITKKTFLAGRILIGVTPADPNYVYLLAGGPLGFQGLQRSEDGGLNFTLRSNSPNILGLAIEAPFDSRSQAQYDLAIAVSTTNAEEVHVGGINCWKSINGGTSWEYTSFWAENIAPPGKYTHADIHALVFNDNILYCGSDGGVYQSDDHAANWTDISSGLEITQLYSISTPAGDPGIIYGGMQDVGVNKWIYPDTFMDNMIGGDGTAVVVDFADANNVYAFYPGGAALSVTEDGGITWDDYFSPTKGEFLAPLIMHPTDPTILYGGYDAVYQITNGGKTFTAISPELVTLFDSYAALGMSAANPYYLYAASAQEVHLCTNIKTDPLLNWSDITGTLPVGVVNITDVGVSSLDVQKAWVSFSGYTKEDKVYQTFDAGKTWINITGTLPNVPVNCIVYHNNGKDGIYIGTDIGVFYKDNTLGDWIPFRNGMPNVIVYDLKISKDRIRAGTFGRGIWESDVYGDCTAAYALSGNVSGYQFYEASDQISSKANIKGGIGTEVKYKAVNQITLSDGFQVVPGSAFDASLGECQGTPVQQRKYRGIYEGVMPGARLRVLPVQSKDKLKPGFKKRKRQQ